MVPDLPSRRLFLLLRDVFLEVVFVAVRAFLFMSNLTECWSAVRARLAFGPLVSCRCRGSTAYLSLQGGQLVGASQEGADPAPPALGAGALRSFDRGNRPHHSWVAVVPVRDVLALLFRAILRVLRSRGTCPPDLRLGRAAVCYCHLFLAPGFDVEP